MSLLDFAAEQRNASTTRRSNGRNTTTGDLPKAKLWLNVGIEVNGKFINLPLGIPVDTMEEVVIRGNNEDWNKLQNARNGLLKAVQTEGDALEAGAEKIIPMQVRIRRISEEMVIDPATNEYVTDFGAILAQGTLVEQPAPKEEMVG